MNHICNELDEVIGLVDNLEDAILLISELQRDIAFIDIELPRKNKVLVMNLKDSVIEFPISSNNIKHLEKLFS